MYTNKDIGIRLKRLRLALGFEQQKDFAQALDVGPQTISDCERGYARLSLDVALKITAMYGPCLEYLYRANESLLPEPLRLRIHELSGRENGF